MLSLAVNAALALHAPASMGATRATGNAVSATMFTGGKQSNPKQNFQKFNKGTIATGKKPAALKNSLKGVSTARSAQSFIDVTGNAYQEVDTFVPQYDEIGVLPPIGRWDPLQIREQGPERYRRFVEMEIKHGRLAMAGFLGVITTYSGIRWPGYLSLAEEIKFSDLVGGAPHRLVAADCYLRLVLRGVPAQAGPGEAGGRRRPGGLGVGALPGRL